MFELFKGHKLGGEKASSTMRNNNGMLYIFENKNGMKIVFDGLNAFARTISVDAGNLYRTFIHKTRWCKGWRLVECLDLCRPNWELINKKIRSCKVIDRIHEKLDNIERNVLSVKKFGRLAWNVICRKNAKNNSFNEYANEKKLEWIEEQKLIPAWKKRIVSDSDYEDMLQRNLSAYESQHMLV